jgi:glycosyltransferase involved in cell wall biosynthesis
MTRCVAFVGPLPPPVHGFSNVCAMMLQLLEARMPVEVFDRAPKHSGFLKFAWQLAGSLRYLAACVRRRNAVLYLALSGGRGQFFDLVYVLAGKLFRQQVIIHHHSFAYINSPSWRSKCLLALVRSDTHVVLSRNMGLSLVRIYGLKADGLKVVSNASFYGSTEDDTAAAAGDAAPINIGFLSNIVFDKGFVEFFAILRRLRQLGVEYRARIAGPLAPAARPAFDELLSAASDVQYVGPVYGSEKERFYRRLDIFLFPTKYANEAEPLVVFEAMRCGVYVIACDRGAISEMLRNGAGMVFTRDEIVESAAMHTANFSRDRRALAAARDMSLQQAQRMQTSGRMELESLLACIQGEFPKENCAELI